VRFLPFEGAGAESTWRLELPATHRSFDYRTIADVILHVRYTARDGGRALSAKAVTRLDEILQAQDLSGLSQLFSLPYDFPTEWAAFDGSTEDLTRRIRKDFFPYLVQEPELKIAGMDLYGIKNGKLVRVDVAVPAGFNVAGFGCSYRHLWIRRVLESGSRDGVSRRCLVCRFVCSLGPTERVSGIRS
jgi:hypothetical protein